jgi:hypothetical protein
MKNQTKNIPVFDFFNETYYIVHERPVFTPETSVFVPE